MNEHQLISLIAGGESSSLEFKSTLRYDLKLEKVNKDLSKVIPKTLASFLNMTGGTLLIGVNDDGEVLGLENDLSTMSRPDIDYFELTFRNLLGKHLGVEVSPLVKIQFVETNKKQVAVVEVDAHPEPVFFSDGDKNEFYVRDGNSSRPMHVKAAHAYISKHFKSPVEDTSDFKEKVGEALTQLGIQVPCDTNAGTPKLRHATTHSQSDSFPPWIKVTTSRVVDTFLKQLSTSVGWKQINIISPWISAFDRGASIRFTTFLRKIVDDGTTVYVVTRPPEPQDGWHSDAIQMLADTQRSNIVFVKNLHAKLYTAKTNTGNFAFLGSANFTQKSLTAEELGVLVNGYSNGKKVVQQLLREANRIYHTPGRQLKHKAKFKF